MMSLRQSWINTGMLKLIIKNNLFPAKVSLIIFIGVYAITAISGFPGGTDILCVFVFCLSALILTIIYPCYLQSYLVDKTKSSVIASLPLKTKSIWFTNYLAGYLIALVTLLIEGILLIVMVSIRNNDYTSDLFYRFIIMIFVLLFVYYTITFLVCSISGRRLGQVIFSIFMYFLPVILIIGFIFIEPYLVPVAMQGIDSFYFYLMIPLVAGLDFINNGSNYIYFHLFTAGLLLIASYYIYKHRENEYVGEPLVYHKINIFIKAGVVIAISIVVFCLVLMAGDIDINYGFSGTLWMLLLYLIVCISVTLIVEIMFKGRHIYRNLIVYLFIASLVFTVNYFVVNNRYLKITDTYMSDENLIITRMFKNDEGTIQDISLSFDASLSFELRKYLSKHRDMIHCDNNHDGLVRLTFFGSQDYDLYVEKDVLINFFENDGRKYFDDIKNYQGIESEDYVIFAIDDLQIYLNQAELRELLAMTSVQEIKPADLINKQLQYCYGNNSENSYYFLSSPEIISFLESPELIKRSTLIDEAFALFDSIVDDYNDDYDLLLEQALVRGLAGKQINLYYCEYNQTALKDFNDHQVFFENEYQIVTEDNMKISLMINFVIEMIDNEIVVTSIEVGGTNE